MADKHSWVVVRYINLRDGGYRTDISTLDYVKLPAGTKVEITI